MTQTVNLAVPPVLLTERCDAEENGVSAGMVTVSKSKFDTETMEFTDQELTFCKHHFDKHEAALIAAGWTILRDSRSTLTARETEVHA